MNAYTKFGKILSIKSQDKILNGIEILAFIKGNNTGSSVRKMICNNPKVDIINMNAYIKFDEILSICSQENQGNKIWA